MNAWLQMGGALPAAEYERLREAGVTDVVDLRQPHEDDTDVARLAALGITRRHVPVPDDAAPTDEQVADVARWFADESDGTAGYVRCGGGFGRAGTMAMGLLVNRGLSLEDAEREVLAARPEVSISAARRAWLQGLEVHNHGAWRP